MQTRIKELRLGKGISQEVLAGFVNSSQQAICRYERDVSSPPSDIVVSMANFFDVSTDYLLCCSDSKMRVESDTSEAQQQNTLNREISMLKQLGEEERNRVSSFMEALLKERDNMQN